MCTKKLAIVGPLILVAVPLGLEVHYIVLEVRLRVEDTVMRHNKIPNTLFSALAQVQSQRLCVDFDVLGSYKFLDLFGDGRQRSY